MLICMFPKHITIIYTYRKIRVCGRNVKLTARNFKVVAAIVKFSSVNFGLPQVFK